MTDEGDVVLVGERGEAAATEGAVALAPAPATVDLSRPADSRTGPSEPTDATVTELPGFRLGNRPPLTGIRALVIGSILVYHSNLANPHSDFTALPGAWAAISVFFVLSGFLITSMLMAERERKGRISLRNFYTRRALRLLPPLAITVGLLAIYAAVVYVPYAHQRVWADISAAAFYYADFRSASGHEFFLGYLGQAWSLSIEEQFYVIWAAPDPRREHLPPADLPRTRSPSRGSRSARRTDSGCSSTRGISRMRFGQPGVLRVRTPG